MAQTKQPTSFFRPGDILDLDSFAAKLKEQRDPVSKHVAKQLGDDTRKQIDAYDGSKSSRTKLAQALVGDLNKVVEGVSLYNEKRFAGVDMPDDLAKASARKSTGSDLVRLNVMLLEAAYPNELLRNFLRYPKVAVERVQTGVRIEKRMLKVLKALAEYQEASLGELLEDIVLHAFAGHSTFDGEESRARIAALKEVYEMDYDVHAGMRMKEPDGG